MTKRRKTSADRRATRFPLLLTASERQAFQAAADRDGRTLSNWLRRVAAAAAVACLFALTSACSAEALAVEPAAPDAPAPTAASVSRETPTPHHVDVRFPKAMDACVPCPDGAHVEVIGGQPMCVQFGQLVGPAGCQDAATAPLCASPGPDHTRHGTLAEPLCMLDPTSADTRPQCYVCSPPEGCCDCLSGAASAVYCLTTCCAGTL